VTPQTVGHSQSAKLVFNGKTLGILIGATPSFSAANVHDVTGLQAQIIGDGTSARIIKQYNVSSIEPGTISARFIGSPELSREDVGKVGKVIFSWQSGNSISAEATLTKLDAEFNRGELIQWSAEFLANGFQ